MCSVYHVKWTFFFRLSYTHNKGYNAVMILVMALLSRPEWRHLALGMSGPVFLLLLWQQNEEIWEKEVPPLMLQTWRHKHPLTHTHLEHIYSTALVVTCLCQDQVTAASVSVGRLEGWILSEKIYRGVKLQLGCGYLLSSLIEFESPKLMTHS